MEDSGTRSKKIGLTGTTSQKKTRVCFQGEVEEIRNKGRVKDEANYKKVSKKKNAEDDLRSPTRESVVVSTRT